MWSLAIEEQFYLVWPLIVYFLLWWRRSLKVLLVACGVMIVGSAALMAALYVPGKDPSRVYYGTDTRAQSLLIGAVVGILLFQHGPIRSLYARTAVRVAAVVGAAYTLWLFWRMSEHTDALYQGGFLIAALAVSAVIVSVVQPDPGRLGRFLSVPPLRWIGRISYGLYLWHWPVYLTLTHTRTGLDGVALLFVRLAVSLALGDGLVLRAGEADPAGDVPHPAATGRRAGRRHRDRRRGVRDDDGGQQLGRGEHRAGVASRGGEAPGRAADAAGPDRSAGWRGPRRRRPSRRPRRPR